ncbi:hypothetical protein FRC02_009888, partial [Tulasnella sp. 418]
VSLGGGMNNNLLIVAWPWNNQIIFSPRVTSNYAPPHVVTRPVITTISFSITSTQWKWRFRCQGCTSWTFQGGSGAIVQDNYSVFGWALSTVAVNNPSNPASTFDQHTDFGLFAADIGNAHSNSYPMATSLDP